MQYVIGVGFWHNMTRYTIINIVRFISNCILPTRHLMIHALYIISASSYNLRSIAVYIIKQTGGKLYIPWQNNFQAEKIVIEKDDYLSWEKLIYSLFKIKFKTYNILADTNIPQTINHANISKLVPRWKIHNT